MRLLLLEDDAILARGCEIFVGRRAQVDWVQRLDAARTMRSEPYDALLVDWRLPDGSGRDWVANLRRQGDVIPILMLTARDMLADRLGGLEAGADDYLVKPSAPEELVARLNAVWRRSVWGPRLGVARSGLSRWTLISRTVWLVDAQVRRAVELTARVERWRSLGQPRWPDRAKDRTRGF